MRWASIALLAAIPASCSEPAPDEAPVPGCADMAAELVVSTFYVELDPDGIPIVREDPVIRTERALEVVGQETKELSPTNKDLDNLMSTRTELPTGPQPGVLVVTTKPQTRVRNMVGERFGYTLEARSADCAGLDGHDAARLVLSRLLREDGGTEAIISYMSPVRGDGSVELPFDLGEIRSVRVRDIGCPSRRESGRELQARTVLPIFTLSDGSEVEVPVGQEVSASLDGTRYVFRTFWAEQAVDANACGQLGWAFSREGFFVPIP